MFLELSCAQFYSKLIPKLNNTDSLVYSFDYKSKPSSIVRHLVQRCFMIRGLSNDCCGGAGSHR